MNNVADKIKESFVCRLCYDYISFMKHKYFFKKTLIVIGSEDNSAAPVTYVSCIE